MKDVLLSTIGFMEHADNFRQCKTVAFNNAVCRKLSFYTAFLKKDHRNFVCQLFYFCRKNFCHDKRIKGHQL